MRTIAGAHAQVRRANLDDTMSMALRMTEQFSEDYFAKLTAEEIVNPFKQLRSEFEVSNAAERAFNMSMSLGRQQGTEIEIIN